MTAAARDRRSEPRLVVGVGASAGGFAAFKRLVAALPADAGLAVLFVQHLDPSHESLLTGLLAPHTRMAVTDAEHGAELSADTIYVIRPGTTLGVRDGRIELSVARAHQAVHLPVDHLFCALAREYGPRAVGVVLSGAASDGSRGIRDIRVAGGLGIAQDPDESAQPGMPRSAIETGMAGGPPRAVRPFTAVTSTSPRRSSHHASKRRSARRRCNAGRASWGACSPTESRRGAPIWRTRASLGDTRRLGRSGSSPASRFR